MGENLRGIEMIRQEDKMSVSGISSLPPIQHAAPIQGPQVAASDADHDGDNDAHATPAAEASESSSNPTVDFRV